MRNAKEKIEFANTALNGLLLATMRSKAYRSSDSIKKLFARTRLAEKQSSPYYLLSHFVRAVYFIAKLDFQISYLAGAALVELEYFVLQLMLHRPQLDLHGRTFLQSVVSEKDQMSAVDLTHVRRITVADLYNYSH